MWRQWFSFAVATALGGLMFISMVGECATRAYTRRGLPLAGPQLAPPTPPRAPNEEVPPRVAGLIAEWVGA
eukprot:SAG31_NODE_21172_length_556_cov_0.894967_1_plen_70_part_01